jgi:hypothetical protein
LLVGFEDALDLFALAGYLGAQPAALDLDLTEAAIERGEIIALPAGPGNRDAGEHREQLRCVREQYTKLGQGAKIWQGDDPQ